MAATYHIRIKKDYAASLIEDLEKMDAIEVISETEESETPKWQIDEVTERIEKYKNAPELLIEEDIAFKIISPE